MLVRSMRMKSNLKVRQPLRRIILPVAVGHDRDGVRRMEDVILDEINVKAIEFVTDDSGMVKKRAKPNFKSIGPKFGKLAKAVAARIKDMTAAEIGRLEAAGSIELGADGSSVAVDRTDVEILREDIEGWLVESDGALTVALDTTLDDQLRAEGFAREFVNRVQHMRKDAGFEVTDRISVLFHATPSTEGVLQSMAEYIQNEILAVELMPGPATGDHMATVEVNGEHVDIAISRRSAYSS
jgi:isoleucyl-tRNA synthetase